MRRLITAFLCLVTLSGAYAGYAEASQGANSAAVISLSATVSRDQPPAVDPVWAAPTPVVLAPTASGLAPQAVQTQFVGIIASTWATRSFDPVQDRAATTRHARWAVISRGYRATGPPQSGGICITNNSSALAA